MFIKKINVKNFKGYKDIHELEFNLPDNKTPGSGLNVLVGENNTGKSSVFEAIYFLRNGTKREIEDLRYKSINSSEFKEMGMEVTAEFVGDIADLAKAFAEKKAKTFFDNVYKDVSGDERLIVQRSGKITKDLKEIKLYNWQTKNFENKTGIDAPFRALFELNCIWADTNPQDEAKFGSSSLCGSLLKAIATNYVETPAYQKLSKTFDEVFNDSSSDLREQICQIEKRVNDLFSVQFGGSLVQFNFEMPTSDVFFKNVKIQLKTGDRITELSDEGMGLQRAVALSLLQVYAETISKNPNISISKPFIFFIDEPEICLHPAGQRKLLRSLLEISKDQQVFISTHSPFFLEGEVLRNAKLIICKKENNHNEICKSLHETKLLPWSPSWGEICFIAYNLPSIDFHNELYGYLQNFNECYSEKTIENWLIGKGVAKTKVWKREEKGKPKENHDPYVTLPTFIRNKIHHPENSTMRNESFTDEELSISIECMISLIRGNRDSLIK